MMLDALYQKNGEEALEHYVSRFHLLRSDGCEGLGDWLWDWLRYNETPYSRLIDQGKSDPALENAARRDDRHPGAPGPDRLRPVHRRHEAPAGQ